MSQEEQRKGNNNNIITLETARDDKQMLPRGRRWPRVNTNRRNNEKKREETRGKYLLSVGQLSGRCSLRRLVWCTRHTEVNSRKPISMGTWKCAFRHQQGECVAFQVPLTLWRRRDRPPRFSTSPPQRLSFRYLLVKALVCFFPVHSASS